MRRALIGYSGFVGSNLLEQQTFDELYNSKNFHDMEGESFDEVVCCGVSAVKWLANKEPEKDFAAICSLQQTLGRVQVKRFILISTIDVYPRVKDVDEMYDCSQEKNHAYGKHRLSFEVFCRESFKDCTIVRLPGLFGVGLKKNVIYDLLNDNCLEVINANSSFQYYNLANLWRDITLAVKAGIPLINLFSEPVLTSEIIENHFLDVKVGASPAKRQAYDIKSCYAHLLGGRGGYLVSRDEILSQLFDYIKNNRAESSR